MTKTICTLLCAIPIIGCSTIPSGHPYYNNLDTPEDVADYIVSTPGHNPEGIRRAIAYGDTILPYLKKTSKDFTMLEELASYSLARVLSHIKTEAGEAMTMDLFQRKEPLLRLIGSAALASQGKFPAIQKERDWLIQTLKDRPAHEIGLHLAIIALGKIRCEEAWPILLDIINRRNEETEWTHVYAIRAVVDIGSKDALELLREGLADEHYAVWGDLLAASLCLGDKDAIPIAIKRVSPKLDGYNSAYLITVLENATGKNYGYDQSKWRKWWEKNGSQWKIPEDIKNRVLPPF